MPVRIAYVEPAALAHRDHRPARLPGQLHQLGQLLQRVRLGDDTRRFTVHDKGTRILQQAGRADRLLDRAGDFVQLRLRPPYTHRADPAGDRRLRFVGENFSRVTQLGGIEDLLDPAHHLAVGVREHERHVLPLVDADAVLTGDRAARRHARLDDLLARRRHPLGDTGLTTVERDVGVQVAVARMEDVGDGKIVLLGYRVDFGEQLGQPAARYRRVLHHEVRADPAHGTERRLARLPELHPLRLARRDRDLSGPVFFQDLLDL